MEGKGQPIGDSTGRNMEQKYVKTTKAQDVRMLSNFGLRNDRYCVGWGVELYSLTHPRCQILGLFRASFSKYSKASKISILAWKPVCWLYEKIHILNLFAEICRSLAADLNCSNIALRYAIMSCINNCRNNITRCFHTIYGTWRSFITHHQTTDQKICSNKWIKFSSNRILQFTAERQAEQVCLELKLDAVGTGPMTNVFCCVCAVLNRGYCSDLLGWRLLAHMVTQEITVAAK